MPHETLRLVPGVDANKTLTLNQAAVSISNLIRYAPDPDGNNPALIQKLGGWSRYFPNAMPAIPRALWPWQDTNSAKRLAIGCDISTGAYVGSLLGFIQSGSLTDITPHVQQDNVAVAVTTSTISNVVTLTDNSSTLTSLDAVFIPTHISVGGIVIFGFYQVIGDSSTQFQVALTDAFGNPVLPTSNVTGGGAVASFTTTNGNAAVNVLLNNHGYSVGSTYPVMIKTTVGGVTLLGNYIVQVVVDANNFTIFASNTATSGASASINSGNARYNFYLSFAPNPPGAGYGVGGYGRGGYGTGSSASPTTGTNISTKDWNLDNWGEILIALPTQTQFGDYDGVSYIGGPLYYWSPTSSSFNAVPIPQGPIASTGMFVAMPQRQIVAYGTTVTGIQDPLLVRWCDVNNFFQWIGQVTNQAGQYRLTRGSRIVGALQISQQALLFTDLGVWSMQYVGPGNLSASVYSFNEIGTGCGLIAQKAVAVLSNQSGNAYWMGQTQFFTYGSNGVQPMVCPVSDVVFQNLDQNNLFKIRAAANSGFNEISWFYPSVTGGTGEVDSYVKYNVLLGTWDYGLLPRSAWVNQSVLGPPIGADPTTNYIQQHELTNDADGQVLSASFQTGYFVLSEADLLLFIDQVWPDMKWGQYGTSMNAQLQLTFIVASYPDDPNVLTYGPFTLTQAVSFVSPRLRGRLVSIKMMNIDTGSFWRLGALRYRFQPDGKFL
jgi:hypothetical protein